MKQQSTYQLRSLHTGASLSVPSQMRSMPLQSSCVCSTPMAPTDVSSICPNSGSKLNFNTDIQTLKRDRGWCSPPAWLLVRRDKLRWSKVLKTPMPCRWYRHVEFGASECLGFSNMPRPAPRIQNSHGFLFFEYVGLCMSTNCTSTCREAEWREITQRLPQLEERKRTHLQLKTVERQHLRRGARKGAKRRCAELHQQFRSAGNGCGHSLTAAAELQYDGITCGVTIVDGHVVLYWNVKQRKRAEWEREKESENAWGEHEMSDNDKCEMEMLLHVK